MEGSARQQRIWLERPIATHVYADQGRRVRTSSGSRGIELGQPGSRAKGACYYALPGEWRNWQTRRIQVPVSERTWGFNSPLAHRLAAPTAWCAPTATARHGPHAANLLRKLLTLMPLGSGIRKLAPGTLWIGPAGSLTLSVEEPTTLSEFGLGLCCGGQVRDAAEMRDRGCGGYVPEFVGREYLRCHSQGIGEPCHMLILANGNGGG
jgi:hypothetical protein